jgi:predicted flavoprotein YhiN
MTAVTILENSENKNLHIDIFEKNPSPGKKLLLSGGGRCNVTTGITDKKILETKYTRGWDFIKKAIGKF